MANLTDIYGKIDTFCSQNQLFSPGAKVLVALSGGADSVFLLRYLMARGYEVIAAHCNFHLRDAESMRDEQFVRQLCLSLSIPLHVQDFDTQTFAQHEHISIEMAARNQRYQWFNQLRQQVKAQSIAVAHHQDDNIENLLLNLVRGTGIKGLCGMQPRRDYIVRPLLCISRTDILAGLKELQQSFVDDSTNSCPLYSRNRLRLEVLPLLHTINPGVRENILTTIDNLREVRQVYEQNIRQSIEACCHREGNTLYINKAALKKAASPLSVLHTLLEPLGFNRTQTQQLLQCSQVGRQFHSATHTALVDRTNILVGEAILRQDQEPVKVIEGVKLEVNEQMLNEAKAILKDSNQAYLDADKIRGELIVRPTRPGDRFRPFGMKGQKLVSDFLTDLKVNRLEKSQQLVVCDDERILWVVGRRVSEDCRVTEKTRRIICLDAASVASSASASTAP